MAAESTDLRRSGGVLASRAAVGAVVAMFAVNGTVVGGWAATLPSLRAKLEIGDSQVAVLLFVAGAFGIASMQVGGRLADRAGARTVTFVALPFMVLAAVTVALAPTFTVALVGAALIGLGNGAMDVAMNAYGVQVEVARGKPIMSRLHAFWSLGNFVGAGSVLLIALGTGLSGGAIVLPVMATLAVLAALVLVGLLRTTPPAEPVQHTVDGVRTRVPAAAYVLGVMAVAFGLAEGTGVDWSAIHVTDVAGVDTTTGSTGLVAVSGLMVVIRLLGDHLVARFGRRAVVRVGGVCAALGYLSATLVESLPLLVVAWGLVGLGVGMIAPQVYAAAGHMGGGRVLAVVVTFGYGSLLMGPAVIGFLVRHLGIQHTMAVPAALCLALLVLAAAMPRK